MVYEWDIMYWQIGNHLYLYRSEKLKRTSQQIHVKMLHQVSLMMCTIICISLIKWLRKQKRARLARGGTNKQTLQN